MKKKISWEKIVDEENHKVFKLADPSYIFYITFSIKNKNGKLPGIIRKNIPGIVKETSIVKIVSEKPYIVNYLIGDYVTIFEFLYSRREDLNYEFFVDFLTHIKLSEGI